MQYNRLQMIKIRAVSPYFGKFNVVCSPFAMMYRIEACVRRSRAVSRKRRNKPGSFAKLAFVCLANVPDPAGENGILSKVILLNAIMKLHRIPSARVI